MQDASPHWKVSCNGAARWHSAARLHTAHILSMVAWSQEELQKREAAWQARQQAEKRWVAHGRVACSDRLLCVDAAGNTPMGLSATLFWHETMWYA